MPKKTSNSPKLFSLNKKLQLIIAPLLIVSFIITGVIIFASSSKSMMANAKELLAQEAESACKSLTITMLSETGAPTAEAAYELLDQPEELDALYQRMDLNVSDDGFALLINTEHNTILSRASGGGNLLSDYTAGTLLNEISSQIRAGSKEVFRAEGDSAKYYVVLAYIEGTPFVLASCIDQTYVYADLERLLIIIALVFVVVTILVSIVLAFDLYLVMKPMHELTNTLTVITDGDFTTSVAIRRNDEVGLMGRSVNDFVSIMRDIISDIRDISGQLDQAGKATKQVASRLNESTDAQASSMGDMKSTMDQVAISVQELALHATTLADVVTQTNQQGERAKENMQQTVAVASRGRTDMEEVNQAMEAIVSSMSQLADIVDKVGASTEQINTMVGIISDISDQTNLLSLNAAIEAARAGDAGRGFAVVAEEIRNLAEVSASSASQISSIIAQVNSQVNYMVEQTTQSAAYIRENSDKITASCEVFENIYKNVTDTDAMLTEIVSQIAHVDGVATNIAALSEEQSASAQEILASTEVMANSSLELSEDSRMVSANADNVAEASFALTEHMRRFKI